MTFFTYAITLTALLLGCLALSVAHAESNDTYNVYLQKVPGPTTVNQGVFHGLGLHRGSAELGPTFAL